MQTVRQALDEKRRELKGRVAVLHLCKHELFYRLKNGEKMDDSPNNSVYPVDRELAAKEAKHFGVEWFEV